MNGREDASTDNHKYEKVVLLIVDFSREEPRLLGSIEDLISENILEKGSDISSSLFEINDLAHSLMNTYTNRFLRY